MQYIIHPELNTAKIQEISLKVCQELTLCIIYLFIINNVFYFCLVTVLMEESKLTMMQRKSIQNAVDKGEPLPSPSRSSVSRSFEEKKVSII